MAEIKIGNVEALGKPLGQYSHLARVKASEFLFIAGAGWGNVVQFTTYLVHSQDIPRFMQWRLREFPRLFPSGAYPPNTLLVIDRLVGEPYLIEVQAVAAL
jgi:enamine deaminase RidA (YjgF/YER057c/UK114 family)